LEVKLFYVGERRLLKRIVSEVMLTLLFIGTLTLTFNIQPVKSTWTGTVYIRADGSVDPPDAPIITYDNVTYTLTDNITSSADGIVVERDNIVIDGAGYTLQGTEENPYNGVTLSNRYNVTIKNINIQSFWFSIKLVGSSNNTIRRVAIVNNEYGVMLYSSSDYNCIIENNIMNKRGGIGIMYSSNYNKIVANNITANNWWGIKLDHSFNNTIVENEIRNNQEYGIMLRYSLNNTIVRNIFVGNGLWTIFSYMNYVTDNLVNGRPLVYLEGITDYRVVDAGQVVLIKSDGVLIENLNLSRASVGALIWQTNNTIIHGNDIANNKYGIYIQDSVNNSIVGNNITYNRFGIEFGYSSENVIYSNNITNNYACGIYFYKSSNNKFYHNNIMNNEIQVRDISWSNPSILPSINVWDDGYPSGGNYWSDYNGTDLFSGSYQNETGSDGIGDTPYVIDGNNQDRYPLMNPWTPAPPPTPPLLNATVDVNPQTLNLRSRGRWITAYVELPEGYNVEDINVSTIMLNDTIPAKLKPVAIGDYDNDSVPDLMVKFDRSAVISCILDNVNPTKLYLERFVTITLTITGKLNDGTPFQGSTTIRIIIFMPRGVGRHIFLI